MMLASVFSGGLIAALTALALGFGALLFAVLGISLGGTA